MKKYLFLFFFFSISVVRPQSQEFKLDYTVKYEIPSAAHGKDTIQVSFDREGNYLFTNNRLLAEQFAKSISKSFFLTDSPSLDVLIDAKKDQVLFFIESEANRFFMQMDLDAIAGTNRNEDTTAYDTKSKKYNLKSSILNEKTEVAGDEFNTYVLKVNDSLDKPIYIAIDESRNYNVNRVLNMFMSRFAKKFESVDIDNGIIMMVKDSKNKVILKAIAVEEKPMKVTFTNSLTID